MSKYKLFLAALGVFLMASSAQATVITGKTHLVSDNWGRPNDGVIIGDGTNHVSLSWFQAGPHTGNFELYWDFYGYKQNMMIAFAAGVTDISQITDASIFSFTNGATIGPYCDAVCDPDGVGDFIVAKNIFTGHYGVLRIDDIQFTEEFGFDPPAYYSNLYGTWWFQTDGTGDFSSVSSVPEPSTYMLFGIGLLVLLGYRIRQRN